MDTWSNGELTMRMDVLIRDSSPNLSWALNYYRDFGDDMLKIGGLKFGMDGGVEGGFFKDPYLIVPGQQNDPNYYGQCSYTTQASQDALKARWLLAAKNGWSVATHNVGDAAIEITLGLYEEVNKEVPLRDLRWRIEHLFMPEVKHLDMMKNMGIIATMQNHPVFLGYNMIVWHGLERASYEIPIRTVLDHGGILVGGGTDAVAHPDPSPFTSMWWMVTRKTLTTDPFNPLGPEEAITIEEALRLYTINNAYAMHWEDKIGSIEPGKLADLVVLDTDILTCQPDDIKNIKVLKTMLGGKIVYEAP
jgi:predicted amidohydrolase YtcJ